MTHGMLRIAAQIVLAFAAGAEPVRIGVPVPSRALAAGLSLRGPGALSWRLLPVAPRADRVFVELAIDGAGDRVRVQLGTGARAGAGGAGPVPSATAAGGGSRTAVGAIETQVGDAVTVARWADPVWGDPVSGDPVSGDPVLGDPVLGDPVSSGSPTDDGGVALAPVVVGRCTTTEWRWRSGAVDRRERTWFALPATAAGERFAAGEYWTRDSRELPARARSLASLPRAIWERAGLLPPGGDLAAPVRAHLRAAAAALVELPGARGRGDFARSGGVVTNLEFDTTLALLRLGLALGDDALLQRARRCAGHLCDRDLDSRTGLPFAHGDDHRSAPPTPGHSWLTGLLWVGLLWADDELVAAARQIAHGLASTPPMGEGGEERARDLAWPLAELEAWLVVDGDRALAAAADRLAVELLQHWRPDLRTFAFGEGDTAGREGYFERGWVTGGLVLPALCAHMRRRPSAEVQRIVDAATGALLQRIGQGRGGLPTHWRVGGGAVWAEHRAVQDPKAFLLLEALPRRDLRTLLRRREVLDGLIGVPVADDPDLPTTLTMAARCLWVYR